MEIFQAKKMNRGKRSCTQGRPFLEMGIKRQKAEWHCVEGFAIFVEVRSFSCSLSGTKCVKYVKGFFLLSNY